ARHRLSGAIHSPRRRGCAGRRRGHGRRDGRSDRRGRHPGRPHGEVRGSDRARQGAGAGQRSVTTFAELTTMRVGGPIGNLVTATTRDEVVDAARAAWDRDEPLLVLGGGSNLVVGDEGFDGTVLRIATRGIGGSVVEAGETWDGVVAQAVAEGVAGIEALSGI